MWQNADMKGICKISQIIAQNDILTRKQNSVLKRERLLLQVPCGARLTAKIIIICTIPIRLDSLNLGCLERPRHFDTVFFTLWQLDVLASFDVCKIATGEH